MAVKWAEDAEDKMSDTYTVVLPNGNRMPDVPVTASQENIQRASIDLGLATLEDFSVSSQPIVDAPWYQDVGNFLKKNMEIPVGLGGTAAGAAIGTAIMPGVGTAIGAVLGGALGSGGGSLLSDVYEGEELDYAEAVQEAAISAGFDVATLGIGKYAKGFYRTMKSLGKSPEQVAKELAERAARSAATRTTDEAVAGSLESLRSSQSILAGRGATMTPYQTGQASGLQVFGQRLGETGILSRKISQDNLNLINQTVSDSLEDVITRFGPEMGSSADDLGEHMYQVITAGKRALSDSYGRGLTELQGTLGNSVVNIQGIKNTLRTFLAQHQREGFSNLNRQTVSYVEDMIDGFRSVPRMQATSLIDLEKKIVDDISQFGNLDAGVYNTVVERQLTQLSKSLRESMARALNRASPGAGDALSSLKKSYADGIEGILPVINKRFINQATKDNFNSLGRMLTQTGNQSQIKKFMDSIDTAYDEIGKVMSREGAESAPFLSASDAKNAIRQSFLRDTFPNIGETFDINHYRRLAGSWDRPTNAARYKLVLGDAYGEVKQLVNLMAEASSVPGSNIGELVLRSKEYAAGGAVAGSLMAGAGGGAAAGLAGTVLFGPVVLSKLATNPGNVSRLLLFNKAKFASTDAMATAGLNLAFDMIRELPEDERTEVEQEIEAMLQTLQRPN